MDDIALDQPQPPEKKTLRVRMELPFDTFVDDRRSEFLQDLSTLTGCPTDQITDIDFRKGCVLFDGKLDAAALERLLKLYDNRNAAEPAPELAVLLAFMAKYAVAEMGEVELHIRLVKREQERPQGRATILVHGWNGGVDSFGRMPEFLRARIDCEVKVYPFPTSLWQHSPSTQFIARNLDNWIRNNIEADQLAFVVHSMGGLIVRRLMLLRSDLPDGNPGRVSSIVFVASPHTGAELAKIANSIDLLRSAQLSEMSPNSPDLYDLNSRWDRWVLRNEDCKIRAIVGTDDRVVPTVTARGNDPEAVPILGAGHIDIVKPKQPDAEIVLTIARFLREAGFPIRDSQH